MGIDTLLEVGHRSIHKTWGNPQGDRHVPLIIVNIGVIRNLVYSTLCLRSVCYIIGAQPLFLGCSHGQNKCTSRQSLVSGVYVTRNKEML